MLRKSLIVRSLIGGILAAFLAPLFLTISPLSLREGIRHRDTSTNTAMSKNIVVVGGSFTGLAAVKELVTRIPPTHRVLLIEPHSHLNYLFAFPRFAVVPAHEHKAFIPYTAAFAAAPDPPKHLVVKARAASLQRDHLVLDREWQGSKVIPFEYAVIATGTKIPAPGSMDQDEKRPSVEYFRGHQELVKRANSIAIVGGGAVGVQMAADIKEFYPQKNVTLVHSRDRLMPVFHSNISQIIRDRFRELDVNLVTGARAVFPPGGFSKEVKPFELELNDGRKIPTELVIPATGQTANTQFVRDLQPTTDSPILNPANGFIAVRPTLQFEDPAYPNLFAAGDVADSGAHKAARPGIQQAEVVAKNIAAMVEGGEPSTNININPPGIHLSLGLKRSIVFRNPDVKNGATEPTVTTSEDGVEDMRINDAWVRRGVIANSPQDYHL